MNHPNPGGSPVMLPAAKPRPGRTGIWIGVVLLVAAIVVPVLLIALVVLPQFRLNEQLVPADGAPHSLTLPRGADYALLAETRTTVGAPSCTLTDANGAPIELRRVSGTVTVDNLMVLRRFDTGSGAVVATCTASLDNDEVALGKYPNMGLLLGGIFGAFGFAIVIGGVGLVVLLMTVIRRANRL